MRLNAKDFKECCTTIKDAIDSKNVSLYTETLELKAEGNTLTMSVTNREYLCKCKFDLNGQVTSFTAAVNAKLFVDLVSKITTEYIDIDVDNNTLKITGNGNYKIPMVYNGDQLMTLPQIVIQNVTNSMNIKTEVLQSILINNSKELQRGVPVKPVQKYYYIDSKGAITFTSGACVNTFTLEKDVKLLLSDKVVKLFKLFKDSDSVSFKIGQDSLADGLIQTKVEFETPNITITAILADTSLVSSVPVDAIRGMASKNYSYSVVVSKDELSQVLTRLMLFNTDKNYGYFEFTNNSITIKDWSSENTETINISNECDALKDNHYTAIINMDSLNLILSGCEDAYVTLCFGDNKAICVKKTNIVDIVPEMKQA